LTYQTFLYPYPLSSYARTDRRTDGRTDRRTDGQTLQNIYIDIIPIPERATHGELPIISPKTVSHFSPPSWRGLGSCSLLRESCSNPLKGFPLHSTDFTRPQQPISQGKQSRGRVGQFILTGLITPLLTDPTTFTSTLRAFLSRGHMKAFLFQRKHGLYVCAQQQTL